MFNKFYNGSIRRMVVAFGSLFNQIYIDRQEANGTKSMLVPISYAPKEKYKVRLAQDPNFDNMNQITLPRMAFEITGYVYDSVRKRNSINKTLYPSAAVSSGVQYSFAEVPYNIDFGLYVYVRNMEDGLRIIEQILPQFSPEFVVTVNFDQDNRSVDVPIFLNSVSSEEDYEGDFYGNRRSIIFTLNFTMKAYIFGEKRTYKEIRNAEASLLNARIFDDDPLPGVTPGTRMTFVEVLSGISGPSGASSGIGNYDTYAKVYQPFSGGGTTYATGMSSGGVTVDWNL
jgi:hypothetical protein